MLKEALNYYEMMKFQIKELELQHICKISLIKDKGLYGNFLKLLLYDIHAQNDFDFEKLKLLNFTLLNSVLNGL